MKGRILTYMPGVPMPKEQEFVDPPGLEFYQKAVGGYIEPVPYWLSMRDGTECLAFCNEDGISLRMPYNEAATLAWKEAFERSTGTKETDDFLLGPVIVITGDRQFMKRMRDGG